ncbi:hypothetical protein SZ47_00235 [Brachyspira hyodysenteriae]|uniref:Lipoprotein n=1 Tax=Brachyspira hyodysenteriae ATCC 27164 TaxID=1266923 RepID=A0A3B6W5A3_BRAHO|nr:hypothetical protein [Brachyspira hyodysenteriae]ANN63804.1 hypothetical protein BHYOB78_07975 [Brachyspira hyodysenteriae ATCC 27164]KLI29175.1 hypothetical protein SZ47_00235 [Brachyspira hyodysenteriae]MCZ9925089.1 hypothetical protein [Brachyspira hyodysenteriae]TVL80094.1 hypothetical protein A9X80_13445 [Brachyspira hyodysenteriae]TVL81983.1 hypothetical protein A9X81_09140 [Brachyspira hyodysenteriae]
MKKVYILLFLNFIFISCFAPAKSYFNVVSANKENDSIKVIVEAKKSGRQSENIFLVSQFLNDDDVIVNTSMSQIGPMMFDKGKYEFNVPLPTNSFTKYTNFIDEIEPETAQRTVNNRGYGSSFFTYMMLMNMMDDRRPRYYDDYGKRRTINRDYYDDKYNNRTSTRRSIFNNSRSTTKRTTVNNNNSSTTKRRTLFKPSSGSSTRKQSTFRRSSTRRRR